jgi:hypothetical protein
MTDLSRCLADLSHPDDVARRRAVHDLGRFFKGVAVLAPLTRALQEDPGWLVRAEAALALSRQQPWGPALGALVKRAALDPVSYVREAAELALQRLAASERS